MGIWFVVVVVLISCLILVWFFLVLWVVRLVLCMMDVGRLCMVVIDVFMDFVVLCLGGIMVVLIWNFGRSLVMSVCLLLICVLLM